MIRRRKFITLVGGAAAWPLAARAQQPGKIYRIGVFTAGAPIRSKTWSILIDALKELGWTEGKNIAFGQPLLRAGIRRNSGGG